MKRITYGKRGLLVAAMAVQLGCAQGQPGPTAGSMEKTDVLTAAVTGMDLANTVPMGTMGQPLPGLTGADLDKFMRGKHVFERPVKLEPGDFANHVSCVACHGAGGTGGASAEFAQNIGQIPANFTEQTLKDGVGTLGFVGHVLGNPSLQPLPVPAAGMRLLLSSRLSTQVAGDGMLTAIPESQLLDREAYQAANLGHLGIKGKIARGNFPGVGPFVGRIGWKGRTPTLSTFNGGAFLNELGMSGGLLIPLPPTFTPTAVEMTAEGGFRPDEHGPDLLPGEKVDVDYFTNYTMPPAPRRFDALGYAAFKKAGCAECHWDGYTTASSNQGIAEEVHELLTRVGYNKRVPAYTDLLLHRMGVGKLELTKDAAFGKPILANVSGQGMADGINESGKSDEYRTAPLWGLRFRPKLMHNGAATTVDQAVRLHFYDSPNDAYDSEANEVVRNYLGTNRGKPGNLSAVERALLLRFMRDL